MLCELGPERLKHDAVLDMLPVRSKALPGLSQLLGRARALIQTDLVLQVLARGELHGLEVVLGRGPFFAVDLHWCGVEIAQKGVFVLGLVAVKEDFGVPDERRIVKELLRVFDHLIYNYILLVQLF